MSPRRSVLTFSTALRRLEATQLVAPSLGWRTGEPRRVDPDLPQFLGVPKCFGSIVAVPLPIARPRFSEDAGGSKQFTIVKTFGQGPLQVSNLRLGEEVLVSGRLDAEEETKVESTSRGEFRYELLEGRDTDGGLDLFPATLRRDAMDLRVPQNSDSGDENFARLDTPPGTTHVDVKIRFPEGLSRRVNGRWVACTAQLQIRARKKTGGSYGDYTITIPYPIVGADNDQELTVTVSDIALKAGAGTYKVLLKLSSVSNGQRPSCRWVAMDSKGPKSVGGLVGQCLIAVRGDLNGMGGDAFLSDLNADVIPELPETVGGDPVATRSPAAAYLDVLQGRGARHPLEDDRFDPTSLTAWKNDCATRGYAFDFQFAREGARSQVGEALKLVTAAGRARHVVRDGLHSVLREPSGDALELFCPANIRPGTFHKTRNAYGDAVHAIRCTFENRERKFRRETFIVFATGYNEGNATEIEDWSFDGSTSRNVVADLAAYHLDVLGRRGVQYELAVELDHLRVLRGDLVRLSHFRIRRGTSWGRVTHVWGVRELTVSRPCTMEVGGSYALRVRQADGDQVLSAVTTVPGQATRLKTATDHGAAEGDLFVFGVDAAESMLCVVLRVAPQEDLTAALLVTPFVSTTASAKGNAKGGPGEKKPGKPTYNGVTSNGGITVHGLG